MAITFSRLVGVEGEVPNLDDVLDEGNSAGDQVISDLADPVDDQDAVTKAFLEDAIGGSQPALITETGYEKALPPGVLVVAPQAAEWTAETLVGLQVTVHPVGDPATLFSMTAVRVGESGSTEPAWSEDGSTAVDDNNIRWSPLVTWAGPWAATSPLVGALIANGNVFISDGGGNSGGSEPDWTTAPFYNDTVSDGDITWSNLGAGYVWAAETDYNAYIIGGGSLEGQINFDIVLPTSPSMGDTYLFSMRSREAAALTGATEPVWDSDPGHATIDGDVVWLESTSTPPSLNIVGIALGDAAIIATKGAVTLVDVVNTASPFVPAAGQGIDNGGDDITLDDGIAWLAYLDGAWRPVTG